MKMNDSVDPLILLKALSPLLSVKGGVIGVEEMEKIVALMSDCGQLVSRCVYLNVLRVTETNTVLEKFIVEGGWTIMNKWLVEAKSSENMALILEIMKLLQRLPLRIEHFKENSTPKLVKSLAKTENFPKVKSVASALMASWLAIIKGSSKTADVPSKKKKAKPKSKSESTSKTSGRKSVVDSKPPPVSKAPSFAKFRKTGLEPDQEPLKKLLPKTTGTKRTSIDDETGVPDKKTKTEVKPQKKITISAGFMDALNSVPTIAKRPVKRKVTKPKNSSSSAASFLDQIHPVQETSVLGEACDFGAGTETGEKSPSPIPSPSETAKPKFNKYGKPMKSVRWAEECRLESIKYFEMEEGERVNVTTQNFKDMLHRERLQEREKIGEFHHKGDGGWEKLKPIDLPPALVEPGCNSLEKTIQTEREKKVLQEIFLDMVPDSPTEPDPEPYEMIPPKSIPTDDPNDPGPLESRSPSPLEEDDTPLSIADSNGGSSQNDSIVLKDKLREILQNATAHTGANGSTVAMDTLPENRDVAFQPPIGVNGEDKNVMYLGGQPPIMPEGEGYYPNDSNMMMGAPPLIHATNVMPQMMPNDQYRMKWGPVHNSMGMNRPVRDAPVNGPPHRMRPPPFHPPLFRGNVGNSWRPRDSWRGQPPLRQGFRGRWNGY